MSLDRRGERAEKLIPCLSELLGRRQRGAGGWRRGPSWPQATAPSVSSRPKARATTFARFREYFNVQFSFVSSSTTDIWYRLTLAAISSCLKQRTIPDESNGSITHGCRQTTNQAHNRENKGAELTRPVSYSDSIFPTSGSGYGVLPVTGCFLAIYSWCFLYPTSHGAKDSVSNVNPADRVGGRVEAEARGGCSV